MIAAPLNDTLKKDSGVNWDSEVEPTEDQIHAFAELKTHMVSPPILGLPKTGRPFIIYCDTSAYAVGVVLLQQRDDTAPKEWTAIGFLSKTLHEA